MSTNATLAAEKRTAGGKGVARRLRAEGRIPAVVYGGEGGSLPIHLDSHDTLVLFHAISVENTIVKLKVGSAAPVDTLVREVQAHHLRPEILHIDFLRVQAGVKIEVQVPVHIEGTPLGVRLHGGLLELIFHDLPVECIPANIPEEIVVDISGLDIGDSVHARDLVLPEGVELLVDEDQTICAVVMPRVEEVEEEEEDEEAPEVGLVGEEDEGGEEEEETEG